MSADPLSGWRETPAKQPIVEFVAAVTDPGSPDFVPERARIAVFDNDGTLWTEQPVYAQLIFALDRAAELGHPTSLEELHAGGMAALIKPCSSGPQPARAGPCNWSSTTPTATGSTPTTVTRFWAAAPARFSLPPPSTNGP
jgi:hypothetical protein